MDHDFQYQLVDNREAPYDVNNNTNVPMSRSNSVMGYLEGRYFSRKDLKEYIRKIDTLMYRLDDKKYILREKDVRQINHYLKTLRDGYFPAGGKKAVVFELQRIIDSMNSLPPTSKDSDYDSLEHRDAVMKFI